MSFLDPAQKITQRFSAELAADVTYQAVPVEWDNTTLESKPEPDPTDVVGSMYIRETHNYDGTFGHTFTQDETTGLASYELLIPLDSALGDVLLFADTIRGWFNRYSQIDASGSLYCTGLLGEAPSVINVGPDDELPRHRVIVTIPWRWSESSAVAVEDFLLLETGDRLLLE